MHNMNGMRGVLASFAVATILAAAAPAMAHNPGNNIVVHLTKDIMLLGPDSDRARLALELASDLQAQGATVTLYVDSEGVGLADNMGVQEAERMLLDQFVEAGGRIVVSQRTVDNKGVDVNNLRPGASVLSNVDIANLIIGANQVIDY